MADEVKQKKCGCGRSPTGFCTGLHALPQEEWVKINAPKQEEKK